MALIVHHIEFPFRVSPQVGLLILLAYSIPAIVTIAIALRVMKTRRERGKCRKCQYDLAGLQGGECPECGSSITRGDTSPPRLPPTANRWYLLFAPMLTCALAVVCISLLLSQNNIVRTLLYPQSTIGAFRLMIGWGLIANPVCAALLGFFESRQSRRSAYRFIVWYFIDSVINAAICCAIFVAFVMPRL